jgi:ParB-like chromosome segregation protein Spo0J
VKSHGIREPILITRKGIIVYGFADWHAAVSAGQAEIDCIDFALDDDEALQLILSLHRPRAAWNDFIRAELALK